MRAFYVKTNKDLFLGNDEAIYIFMTKALAEKYLETTDAEPMKTMRVVQIEVTEVQ
jgi:hypothetical protein